MLITYSIHHTKDTKETSKNEFSKDLICLIWMNRESLISDL